MKTIYFLIIIFLGIIISIPITIILIGIEQAMQTKSNILEWVKNNNLKN